MIRLFAGHPTAAALLALAFAVLGLVALPGVQRDTFPDFRADRVQVSIVYPGAAAEEVEESLCLAIEDALDGLVGIDEASCIARANQATAEIELVYGHDVGQFLIELKTEIDAIDTFPPEIEQPIVRQLDVNEPVVSLAVSGSMSATDLRNLAEDLKGRLLRIPGVAEVVIGGFSQRQLEVSLDDARLRALGLSAAAVATAIEQQSLDLPVGTLETAERDIRVRFTDRRRTVRELERLVLRDEPSLGTVRLADVARISESFIDAEMQTLVDGERAAVLAIRRSAEADALRVFAAIEAFVEEERGRLPASVAFTFTDDITSLIADRLEMLLVNAGQGFVLALLTLWAFFSIRFSLLVAAALPLSLLAAIFVLDALGYTIDMMSMVGLLISLGLLIDSSIVINENIARHAERGLDAVEAAERGVREVSGAVLASFLTSIAIFAPTAFLEGNIGRILLVVPVVLIIALATSLVVSFLVLPFFTARALVNVEPHRLRRRLDEAFERFRERRVGALVGLAISWRYLTLGLTGFLFLASLALVVGGQLRFQAFPEIEGDMVEARLMMVAGTPFERTVAVVDQLVEALERVGDRFSPAGPEDEPLLETVTVEFARNPSFADQGPHLATVRGDLLTSERRDVRVDEVLAAWRQELEPFTDVVSLSFEEREIGPAGRDIEVRLAGESLGELRAAGEALRGFLQRYDGVSNITTDIHPGAPEIHLRLADGAGRLGLDAATIATQLRSAIQGITADEIPIGRETVRIEVRHGEAWRSSLGRFDDFVLTLDDGRQVPLLAVADVDWARGVAVIPRIDGRRVLTLTADVERERANANALQAAIDTDFASQLAADHPTVTMRFAGQAEEQAETGASVLQAFVIGLLGMFIVLSFHFRSLVEPLIVMLAIPLALTGVIWGHLLMGLDLSMPSIIGFVSLAGIVVNNSILLVAFIDQHREAERPIAEAARRASLDRFRPIVMTTATTVAGLVPLLFETSVQAQVLIPLVTSLAFGLTSATLLVLFLVPAVYVILDDLRGLRKLQPSGNPQPST